MRFKFKFAYSSLVWRMGELAMVLVLIGLICWLSIIIQNVRRSIIQNQARVEESLEGAGVLAVLKSDLDDRREEIQKIRDYIPVEASIGEFVASLEKQAMARDVELRIPLVEEAMSDEEGSVGGGPLRDLRLQIVVRGNPENALHFFQAIETMPYLVRVESWRMTIDERVAAGSSALAPASIPGAGGLASGSRRSETRNRGTDLTLNLLLAIIDDEN